MKRIYILFGVLAIAIAAHGQVSNPSIITVSSDPTGQACTGGLPNEQYQGTMFTCKGGVWTASGANPFAGCISNGSNGINCTGSFGSGATPPTACGASTGCLALTAGAVQGTPTAGQSYQRYDANFGQVCSINGSPEIACGLVASAPPSGTYFYSQNFDGATVGALPTGWANIGTATYTVGTTNPVSLANDLEDPVFHVGGISVYTGHAAVADSAIYSAQKVQKDGSGFGANIGMFVRLDAAGANGYLLACDYGVNNCQIFKLVSGTYTQLNVTSTTMSGWANGDIAETIFQASGTTITWKAWKAGTPEPTAWTASITDASISAAGYIGLYEGLNNSNHGTTTSVVDNIVWASAGSTL